MKKISIGLFASFLVIVSIFYVSKQTNNSLIPVASASTTCTNGSYLSGWAWSSNIGWLSFNSGDGGAGGGPYSVLISTSTGALSGYAWSPNIGWVSFNYSSGCPSGSCSPYVNLTTGKVTGWARAIAGVGRTDGWDGWIHLSDNSNHISPNFGGTGGVTLSSSTHKFLGYAWGDTNVGWLQFNPPYGGGVSYTDCSSPVIPTTLTGTCTVDNTSLPSSGGVLNYNVINPSGGTLPYTYNPSIPLVKSISSVTATTTISQQIVMTDANFNSVTLNNCPVVIQNGSSPGGGGDCSVNPTTCVNFCNANPLDSSCSNGDGTGINLHIDTTSAKAASTNKKVLSIIKGNYFGLAWSGISSGDTCTAAVSSIRNLRSSDAGVSLWTNGINSNIFNSNLDNQTTKNVDSDQYTFKITCISSDSSDIKTSNNAILKVNASGERQQ